MFFSIVYFNGFVVKSLKLHLKLFSSLIFTSLSKIKLLLKYLSIKHHNQM